MHQSIPAAAKQPPHPPPPGDTAEHLPALSVQGVGYLQILCCPGAGHLPTPGTFPSVWQASGFLSAYYYTKDFTGNESRLAHLSWTWKKLERFVKACSWFCACISSLLIKPELQAAKSGTIDENQRFLVIESNFCWYYLKNILFIFVKLFTTYNFTALY